MYWQQDKCQAHNLPTVKGSPFDAKAERATLEAAKLSRKMPQLEKCVVGSKEKPPGTAKKVGGLEVYPHFG